MLSPFQYLQAPHYFVEGNHDQAVGIEKVIPLIEEQGVHFLRNQVTSAGPIQLIGFNNMSKDSVSFDLHTIPGEETIFGVVKEMEIDSTKPTIALHHRPEGGEYLAPKGVDLLLAGHTHGGQMFPFTLIAKQMYPHLDGLYSFQNLSIYVSEGIGTIFFPIRIGTQSEITLIHLTPKSKNL